MSKPLLPPVKRVHNKMENKVKKLNQNLKVSITDFSKWNLICLSSVSKTKEIWTDWHLNNNNLFYNNNKNYNTNNIYYKNNNSNKILFINSNFFTNNKCKCNIKCKNYSNNNKCMMKVINKVNTNNNRKMRNPVLTR